MKTLYNRQNNNKMGQRTRTYSYKYSLIEFRASIRWGLTSLLDVCGKRL